MEEQMEEQEDGPKCASSLWPRTGMKSCLVQTTR